MSKKPIKLYIHLNGGLVESVRSDKPLDIDVQVIDHDVIKHGAEEDEEQEYLEKYEEFLKFKHEHY